MSELAAVRADLAGIGRALARVEGKLDAYDRDARAVEGRLSVLETDAKGHGEQLGAMRDHGQRLTRVETQAAIRPWLAGGAGLVASLIAAAAGMSR